MRITEFMREDLILPDLRSHAKPEVLRELAAFLAAHHDGDLAAEDVLRVLEEREKAASTAIGEGIAIPHGKLGSAGQTAACLARSRKGVDFGAIDGGPTHFFFAMIAPRETAGTHLKVLARVSLLFQRATLRSRLLAAPGAREMYAILAAEDAAL